ncbi:hypothetical protein [Kibdelosporangium aridum]|uniref:hypothetical protein n=1 Tax=Kibdelosporangium aridum TaxID=2030 RepID=UPI0005240D5B
MITTDPVIPDISPELRRSDTVGGRRPPITSVPAVTHSRTARKIHFVESSTVKRAIDPPAGLG